MFPEIVRTPSLSAKAKELLQSAILSGKLPPGTHLVESQLAAQFQISRGPLREALQALAAEGLVDIQPARGAFVINPTPDEIEDMIVLRAVLGGMAARYVTASKDEALFGELGRAIESMQAAVAAGDEGAFFDHHWTYYQAMYRATNAVLFRAWSSLHGIFDLYVRHMGRPFLPLPRILMAYECFLSIFRSGNVDEAEGVVRSETLIVGFQVLQRPIPAKLHGYLTQRILDDGTVAAYRPDDDLAARRRKKKAP
jgi:DNA-binding GntR family transcriptional regulator